MKQDLVIAMIVSHLKRLNATTTYKKCLYLCNSLPIIYEMKSYLKSQLGLGVFYWNSRISLRENVSKFDAADVCMFKMNDFLKVFLSRLFCLFTPFKNPYLFISNFERKFTRDRFCHCATLSAFSLRNQLSSTIRTRSSYFVYANVCPARLGHASLALFLSLLHRHRPQAFTMK